MRVACDDCGHEVPVGQLGRCPEPECQGILAPTYTKQELDQLRSASVGRGLDRYRAALPTSQPLPDGGEGFTPLVRSRRIGPELGLQRLWFKLEGSNPSGSFKDRPAVIAAAMALEAGASGILTASSGNAGSAIASFAAKVDLPCAVLLEPGNPPGKTRQMLLYGAHVVPVEGVFQHPPDELSAFLIQAAEQLNYYLAFVWAPVNPYLLEGIKSVSYEIVSQLGRPPAATVAPVGGGDMLTAQWRGYKEAAAIGWADSTPRMIAAQSTAAPPLLRAFEDEMERVPVLDRAESSISGINVAFSGDHALAAVRESGGSVVGLEDETIVRMQTRLARQEGIWVEPAGAAPVAAVERLAREGEVAPEEDIVCFLSGAGFKDAMLAAQEAEALLRREAVPFEVQAVLEDIRAAL